MAYVCMTRVCTFTHMPSGDQKTTFGNQSPGSTREFSDQTQWAILPAPPHICRRSQTVLQYEPLQPAWLFPSLLAQKLMQLRLHGPLPGAGVWAFPRTYCFKIMMCPRPGSKHTLFTTLHPRDFCVWETYGDRTQNLLFKLFSMAFLP